MQNSRRKKKHSLGVEDDQSIGSKDMSDGTEQRLMTCEEEVSSPAVAVESFMLSAIIDAKEERQAAVVDTSIAFVHCAKASTLHKRFLTPVQFWCIATGCCILPHALCN